MGQRHRRLGLFGAFLVGLLLSATPAVVLAQDTEPAEDLVVANVNGKPIYRSQVLREAQNLPSEYQDQIEQVFPELVEHLIEIELLNIASAEAGLVDDAEVQRRSLDLTEADAIAGIMREVYLTRKVQSSVSEEALRSGYEALVAENSGTVEIRARHIVLETEEEAREVIAALDDGADFAELAYERSTGPSSAQGGDLGFFTTDQMIPDFSEAAFGLQTGAYTSEPVQTQFGWHVILAEDRRGEEPPSFEAVEAQLRTRLEREIANRTLSELRAAATIEIFPWEVPSTGSEPQGERYVRAQPNAVYTPEALSRIRDTMERDIVDLLAEGKIDVVLQGSGIERVQIRLRRLVDHELKVLIPVGTFFVSKRASAQNMVGTADLTVVLGSNEWTTAYVPTACANRPRDIPGTADRFRIERSPRQRQLAMAMPALNRARVNFATKQAAVWIITDNASFNDLGSLVSRSMYQNFGGTRVIRETETARAMQILDESGFDITRRKIWQDRKRILANLEDNDLKVWLNNR